MSAIRGRQLGFGAGGAIAGLDAHAAVDLAQSADELGFELFTLSDHLHSQRPIAEPWTALTWIAATTKRIEIGTNVLGLPYRPPPVLAKHAETLDRLSGGRLIIGLGAGGYDQEFEAFGLTVRSAGEKITAQREAITILRSLWAQRSTTFEGSEFTVREATIDPLPEHPIPIWLGSYGPRALALTGELADGWVPSWGRIGRAKAVEMRTVVRAAAAAAGRDPDDELTYATNVSARVDPTTPTSPALLTGDPDAVARQLVEVVEAGFTYLLLGAPTVRDQEILARDVIPHVRAAVEELGLLDPARV